MKKVFPAYVLILLLGTSLFACAPVISKELMDAGIRDVTLFELRQNPDLYRGKLFVLGGVIMSTRATPEGSVIEALYTRVDSQGYLTGDAGGKYLALLPKEKGSLDPLIYHEGKRVTVAAEFIRMREDKPGEPGHTFPFFEVKQIYLWEEEVNDQRYPPGFYWRNNPLWWY